VDPEFVEVAQGTRILILILLQAGKFDILYSLVRVWKKTLVKPTNFHDLQLTLHLVIVAVLLELLFEVIDLSRLQCFASGVILRTLIDFIHQTLNLAGILSAFSLQRLLLGVCRCRLCFQGSRKSLAF